jgi:hypothetical protein
MTTGLWNPYRAITPLPNGVAEIACGSKELNPPFPFPPGASRGGARSPDAGSTLRASKRRWHAALLPAPPTRGLPPPCESPAEQRYRTEERARTTEHGRMVVKGETFTQNT